MLKHEQYEELCTLAMIGEVSPAEIEDLRQHLGECAACRDQYREFTQFILPQLWVSSDNDASFETGYSKEDGERLRRDFLAAAKRGGRVFSGDALRATAKIEPAFHDGNVATSSSPARLSLGYRCALAASIAAAVCAGGYATHLLILQRQAASNQPPTTLAAPSTAPHADAESAIAQLRAVNQRDTRTIAELEQKLAGTAAQLDDTQRLLQAAKFGQSALQAQLTEKASLILTLQSQTQGEQQTMNDLRGQVAQLQQRVNAGQTTIAANELRLKDLNDQLSSQTASLNREREMLVGSARAVAHR